VSGRVFGASERAALYLAADGKCSLCGCALTAGWHADHVHPHSRGGETDVINGQALCPSCNLQKGDKTVSNTRKWQDQALDRFHRSGTENFLVTATPGAGKTRFALAAARELLNDGVIEKLVVVCPSSHLRKQWSKAAKEHADIDLDYSFANGAGVLAKDYDGLIATYQGVASEPLLYRRMVSRARTLVVLDEVHHAGESKTWGDGLRSAFEPAARRILLSGTPFRSDDNPIPFVRYAPNEQDVMTSQSDFSYGYGPALRDNIVRPIEFVALDSAARWRDAGVVVEGHLNNTDKEQARRALRTALRTDGDWIGSVLGAADRELTRARESMPDAGGLVVASTQFQADAYADLLRGITGDPATVSVATSDKPEASSIIGTFSVSSARWLVAVQMVSEGVDIPRLAVGVYASTTSTALFFRQVVGRFIRTRGDDDDLCASLFIPSTPPLLEFAQQIAKERDHELGDEEDRDDQKRTPRDGMTLNLSIIESLGSSAAVHHSTILSGETFSDAELTRALELKDQYGMPGNVTPAQMARLLRGVGGLNVASQVQVQLPVSESTLTDRKKSLRKGISTKVGRLARMTGQEHSHIHAALNGQCGDTSKTATAETLGKRSEMLVEWIEIAR